MKRTMKSPKSNKKANRQRLKAKKKLTKMASKGKLNRNVRDQMKEMQRRKMQPKQKCMDQIRRDWLFERKVREREEEDSSSSDFDGNAEQQEKRCRTRSNRKRAEGSNAQMDEEDNELEEHMRSFVGEYAAEEHQLLPVKIAGKLVKRVKIREMEVEKGVGEGESNDETKLDMDLGVNAKGAAAVDIRPKSAAESEATLAESAGAIVADPQENIAKFRQLLRLAAGESELSPSVREHLQKLAVASLTELFINVLPGYEIRPLTETEKSQKMKKETKRLADFEASLLNYYVKFLRLLEKNANNVLLKSKKYSDAEGAATFSTRFSFLCVRCLCRLIEKCSHFNYAKNIITCLVRLSTTPWKKMSDEICATISEVFRADLHLNISSHGANAIALLVNKKSTSVPAELLSTFLALNLIENEKTEPKKAQSQMSAKWKSKRSRKYDKHIGKIDAELKEAIVTKDNSAKLELATQTTKSVFLTYCRVLKRMPATVLLRPVLAGLTKFVHLINAELHEDLARHLGSLVQQKQFGFSDVLLCVHTAAVVLEGDGRLLGVDLLTFHRALFAALPNVCFQSEHSLFTDLSLLSQCLHLLFVRCRKSALSPARVAAFAKRLTLVALPLQTRSQAVLLLTLRRLLLVFSHDQTFAAHPTLLFLVRTDDESPFTNGRFLADSPDADLSNGLATNLHSELRLFAEHPNILIRSIALNLLNGIPSTGKFRLEAKWTTIEPSEFSLMDDSTVEDESTPYFERILRFCDENKRKYCSTSLCSTLCDFAESLAAQQK